MDTSIRIAVEEIITSGALGSAGVKSFLPGVARPPSTRNVLVGAASALRAVGSAASNIISVCFNSLFT